jgi:uncharacterized protein (DUF952 family)
MRRIYHIVSREEWERAGGKYAPVSLTTEGFVHCSNEEQVERIANLFYASAAELVVLVLEVAKLPEVRDEVPDQNPFPGQSFPHVYGAIPREAVVEVREMGRDENGMWKFASGEEG